MPRRHPAAIDKRRWYATRQRVLQRAGHRCALCGARATHADHVKPVGRGGDWWALSNLRALCAPCHKQVSRDQARPLGPRAKAWADFAGELA